jgi:hypothetical protein
MQGLESGARHAEEVHVRCRCVCLQAEAVAARRAEDARAKWAAERAAAEEGWAGRLAEAESRLRKKMGACGRAVPRTLRWGATQRARTR